MCDVKERVWTAIPGGLEGGMVLKNSPECCSPSSPTLSYTVWICSIWPRLCISVVCYHLPVLDLFIHLLSPRSVTGREGLPGDAKVHAPSHVSLLKPSLESLLLLSGTGPAASSGADGDCLHSEMTSGLMFFFFLWSDIMSNK